MMSRRKTPPLASRERTDASGFGGRTPIVTEISPLINYLRRLKTYQSGLPSTTTPTQDIARYGNSTQSAQIYDGELLTSSEKLTPGLRRHLVTAAEWPIKK